jgi:hypothetical protein
MEESHQRARVSRVEVQWRSGLAGGRQRTKAPSKSPWQDRYSAGAGRRTPKELKRQAKVLGRIVTQLEWLEVFGLAQAGDPKLEGDELKLPKIQSIRSSRRVGPSGQIVFDIVAEVTQKRVAKFESTKESCTFYGGSTVIIDPDGKIRYVIAKKVTDRFRRDEQKKFLDSPAGNKYKGSLCGFDTPNLFKMLHEQNDASNKGQETESKPDNRKG